MWRDGLRLVGVLVAAVWARGTCRRDHGLLLMETDGLYVYCERCGYVSPGIVLETRAIRRAWRFDRQRARFPRRRAS